MGLLDKLWDDTVAGPRPDTGLGRLRKHAARPAAVKINDAAGDAVTVVPPTTPAAGEEAPVRVTRSIMIKRPAGCPASPRSAASTPPASPAGSTPPISPFAGAAFSNDIRCPSSPVFIMAALLWTAFSVAPAPSTTTCGRRRRHRLAAQPRPLHRATLSKLLSQMSLPSPGSIDRPFTPSITSAATYPRAVAGRRLPRPLSMPEEGESVAGSLIFLLRRQIAPPGRRISTRRGGRWRRVKGMSSQPIAAVVYELI